MINDGVEPIMLSIDPHTEKIYLINDFLAPADHLVPWALGLHELHSGNEESLWDNPIYRGVLLVLLIMCSGLNSSGMILEMSIYEEDSLLHLHQSILDKDGNERGKLQIAANNVLLIDAEVDIQIIALQTFLAARDTSIIWNADWLGYQIYSRQFENLPADLMIETLPYEHAYFKTVPS